ncbi:MAG: response regulator transcription factor [Anaerolineae bacterium]|nr:response regulator transcription factor [Anaerolineae bacterium]
MKIMIVDDELAIRDALGRKLRREGFDTVLCGDGHEGLRAFQAERPDLVVLDIVMPNGMDGLRLCRRIREMKDTPVMLLSAQAITEDDIIEGLNAGADEYLIKPVRLNEFVARVQAMLRRAQATAAPEAPLTYNDGWLLIDTGRRTVSVNDEAVHLTPREFRLLALLFSRSGRVVTQREILQNVWGHEYLDDVYYPRVYISQLRRKIERDPADPRYIQTEHRIGYRFEKQDAPQYGA